MSRYSLYCTLLLIALSPRLLEAQKGDKMPRENVVDVPAIGDGLSVSNVFQTNMVLQRDKPAAIWGWADVGERVTVTFGANSVQATAADDRSWKASLPAMTASSNPQTLTIQGTSKKLTLRNVLVGDVWVLGGQSNMEFPLDRIENGQLEIVSANYPNIRILTVPAQNGPRKKLSFARLHEWSGWFGRHYRKGDWDTCTPEIARELSAIGYVFARRIHMATQVPIGVIDASRGGTTVETWTPASVLSEMEAPLVKTLLSDWETKLADWDAQDDLNRRAANYRKKVERFAKEGRKLSANDTEPTDLQPGPSMDQNRPGNCYASMLGPLDGLSVKGAIFHQGYNNCFNGTAGADMYRQIFPRMIAAWRETFDNPNMPFGILSLCTEGPVQTLDNYSEMMANAGPYIREAQYQTFLELYQAGDKNIGFTSTYDLRRRWYHPQLKIPAGERIARWALATQYGFDRSLSWKPSFVQAVKVDNNRLILTLDKAASAIDNGGPILGFAVAAEDRKFHPAKAEHLVTGKDNRGRAQKDMTAIVLTSPMVPQPLHYRYAWARSPLGNLQTHRMSDVPFATQRSDDWPMEQVPLGVHEELPTGKLDRRQRRKLTEALRQQDADRILKEAAKFKAQNQEKIEPATS